jgi:hypothetical protein
MLYELVVVLTLASGIKQEIPVQNVEPFTTFTECFKSAMNNQSTWIKKPGEKTYLKCRRKK